MVTGRLTLLWPPLSQSAGPDSSGQDRSTCPAVEPLAGDETQGGVECLGKCSLVESGPQTLCQLNVCSWGHGQ